MESFLDGKVTLHRGDCLDVLATLEPESVDSCVTDPPYGLFFMSRGWDAADNIAFSPLTWELVFRVLKPGAHLLAFSGTRTYHRMACAIEDAGFEIRDQIGWCYGSGFPKSHDVAKQIDKAAGHWRGRAGEITIAEQVAKGTEYERTDKGDPITPDAIKWQGWGTALKPAWEPIVLARKPLSEKSVAANVLKHGTGAINVDGCRVPLNGEQSGTELRRTYGFTPNEERARDSEARGKLRDRSDPLKKAAPNPADQLGRFPANLIHDGSEEVVGCFPETKSGNLNGETVNADNQIYGSAGSTLNRKLMVRDGDQGSAARFFASFPITVENTKPAHKRLWYTSKADSDDRLGSKHPTVKPLDLIQYLVRLITPRNGVVLDPFAGTGTCGEAAFREGMRAILIEREEEYQADIVKRMGLVLAGPDKRRAATVEQLPPTDLPMFALSNDKGTE